MFGKLGQRALYLFEALAGLAGQVQCPSQTGLQPGRIGIQMNRCAQQINCFAKTMPAQCERGARTRDPRVVWQMVREQEG